jgi:hypothetical protein
MSRGLEGLILKTIERWSAGRYQERHGLVTSYDSQKYLAKVTFQPEGEESGWLPIETGHIGQGYGMTMGLQPGSGQGGGGSGTGPGGSSSGGSGGGSGGGMGDQVIIRGQEGDFESMKIVSRVHSDQDTPPETKSGEIITWTKFKKDQSPGQDAATDGGGGTGCKTWHKNDGSLISEDGNGAQRVMDGKGNYTVSSFASSS